FSQPHRTTTEGRALWQRDFERRAALRLEQAGRAAMGFGDPAPRSRDVRRALLSRGDRSHRGREAGPEIRPYRVQSHLPAKVEVRGGHVEADTRFPIPYVQWGLHDPSVLILRVARSGDIVAETRAGGRSPDIFRFRTGRFRTRRRHLAPDPPPCPSGRLCRRDARICRAKESPGYS